MKCVDQNATYWKPGIGWTKFQQVIAICIFWLFISPSKNFDFCDSVGVWSYWIGYMYPENKQPFYSLKINI